MQIAAKSTFMFLSLALIACSNSAPAPMTASGDPTDDRSADSPEDHASSSRDAGTTQPSNSDGGSNPSGNEPDAGPAESTDAGTSPDAGPGSEPEYQASGGSPIVRWIRISNTLEQFACDCEAGEAESECDLPYATAAEFACHLSWDYDHHELGEALDCQTDAFVDFLNCLHAGDACMDEAGGSGDLPCNAALDESLDECEGFQLLSDPLHEDFEEYEWCLDR